MPKTMMVVLTDAVDGQDDAYNDWYNHRHLADVTKIPGITSATRWEFSDVVIAPGAAIPNRYLALYEIDADDDADLERVAASLMTVFKVDDGEAVSPALDSTTFRVSFARHLFGPVREDD